jgi:hypothetical protein
MEDMPSPKEMWRSYEINAFVFLFSFSFLVFFTNVFLGKEGQVPKYGEVTPNSQRMAFIHFLNNSSEVGE